MRQIHPFIKILRIHNALIAAIAVMLGFWLSDSFFSAVDMLLLFITTVASTGFGNVINDIHDIASDKISHPQRPLPRGDMAVKSAWIYCLFLIFTALICSFSVSETHGFATFLPLVLLTIYSMFLKGTPLIGNFVVAALVAYSILFGALSGPGFSKLILPAVFAFLLNFSREIIKDIQDEAGDKAASVITSAILPRNILRTIIFTCSIIYLPMLFIPYVNGSFGTAYLAVCLIVILPLHLYRSFLLFSKQWDLHLARISLLFKVEMMCGLLSIAIDHLLR